MAIIRKGEIIASCTPQEAISQITGAIWEAALPREQVSALKKTRLKIVSSQMFAGRMRVKVYSKGVRPGEEFSLATPSLEDYYFSLSSRPESVN
jgi:hypothetical protein